MRQLLLESILIIFYLKVITLMQQNLLSVLLLIMFLVLIILYKLGIDIFLFMGFFCQLEEENELMEYQYIII